MSNAAVTQEEIQVALDLSARKDFNASLAQLEQMLPRTEDAVSRMTVLFGIVTCSTWLNLNQVRDDAIKNLKKYPDWETSLIFINTVQAEFLISSGRAHEALNLLNSNIGSQALTTEEMRDFRHHNLFLKGRSLTCLARCEEALESFKAASVLAPAGKYTIDILIDSANCLLALSRYDEAYEAAEQVLSRDEEELATLALQHMAEARLGQGRATEAIELYTTIQHRLPCNLIQEERIQAGITNAMAILDNGKIRQRPS